MAHSRICSIDGCGKREQARGWCSMHYTRWRLHGGPFSKPCRSCTGKGQKFLRDVVLPYDGSACLLWPFSRSRDGYAVVTHNGRQQYVSHLVCEHANGPPPTPRHHAAHSCGRGRNGCVAQRHVRWATPRENEADKLVHDTHTRGERHALAKLTEADVRKIRLLKGRFSQKRLGEMFGVSQTNIGFIHRGKSWTWLE